MYKVVELKKNVWKKGKVLTVIAVQHSVFNLPSGFIVRCPLLDDTKGKANNDN